MSDAAQLARERSHADARSANEHARAASQAAIIINGGAATAIIAFVSRAAQGPISPVTQAISYALIGYAIGVLLGALMTFCIMKYMQVWSEYWTEIANGKDWNAVQHLHLIGLRWMQRAQISFAASMLLFAISSCVVAASLVSH